MAGSPNATLKAAGVRSLLLAVAAGALTWFTAYITIDDSCPSAETRTVKRLEESGKNQRLLAEARKDAREARGRCLKKVERQEKQSLAAGASALGVALLGRGGVEGYLDRRRQLNGLVKPQDVQPN